MNRHLKNSIWRNPRGQPTKPIQKHTRKTTIVRIDHDISFSDYDTTFIKNYAKKIPYKVKSMYIRSSTGGNTHVKLEVDGELSPIDTLLIRAVFHDDARRIRGDLERYLLDSPVFGLLFDEKWYPFTGEREIAGEWIKV